MKSILKKIRQHKLSFNTKVVCTIIVLITVMNMMSVICYPFAKFYRSYVFHNVSILFSRITGLTKISVGEVMICLGILMVIFAVIIFALGFIPNPVLKRIRRIYFRFVVYAVVFVYFTETVNCFMLYHAGTLSDEIIRINERISAEDSKSDENNSQNTDNVLECLIDDSIYEISGVTKTDDIGEMDDIEKLLLVYNHVTVKMNELSKSLPRYTDGDLVCDFTYSECKEAMRGISDYYTLLKGYYPNPKKIYYSEIMSQQYLEGIYFPFSMEANYNSIMYCSNYPSVICHELSHLKGYIREDEANYISYVACINSDNDFIRYSGYLSVYYYLLNDLYEYGDESVYSRMVMQEDNAGYDDIFLKPEDFQKIEEEAIISTETLSDATDKFLESNLRLNGVSSGMENYSEVVKLLILYYRLY